MAGPTIEFLGRQSDEAVAISLSHCRALIFPGEEDFGMAPLEANAAGRPVIAFKGGGASETVLPGLNGIFFPLPTADSLITSLETFENMQWQPSAIRALAESFDSAVFRKRIRAFVETVSPKLFEQITSFDADIEECPVETLMASRDLSIAATVNISLESEIMAKAER